MKKFSIITPSFNQGRFLEETIRSVINQTYKNFELIIIDGGSTDESVEIIKKYEKHLAYWVSEKDKGQSHAINKGLKLVTGDYVTWLNSDDYLEPNALELVSQRFEMKKEVSIVHGKSIFFGEKIKSSAIGPEKLLAKHEYLSYMRFPQPSSFLKKEVFDACGNLNQDLHYGMDFELIAKSVLLGFRFEQIENVLSHYRLHENSKSNNDLKFLSDWSKIVGNVFFSLENGNVFVNILHELKIIDKNYCLRYPSVINLTHKELEDVLLEHLHLHYHINYRALNVQRCIVLSDYMKINYPEFFVLRNFKKYNRRLRFIPKFIFKLVRK